MMKVKERSIKGEGERRQSAKQNRDHYLLGRYVCDDADGSSDSAEDGRADNSAARVGHGHHDGALSEPVHKLAKMEPAKRREAR